MLIFFSMVANKSRYGRVGYTTHSSDRTCQPHDPVFGTEAVESKLKHFEDEAQNDGVLATQVLHEEGEECGLREHRQEADKRYEGGDFLF